MLGPFGYNVQSAAMPAHILPKMFGGRYWHAIYDANGRMKLILLFYCLQVIVHSHTELRCPECRVLVEIKIDDLPPNVLLMRILEGMKNVASIQALNSLSNHKLSMQSTHSNQQANNLSSLEANETCGDNGNASNVETKRVSQNGGSEMAVKHNQDHLNGIKLADGIIPAQRGVLSAGAHSAPNNKQILQHCGSSLNTPCAKALYDFDSKEPR